VASLWEVAVKRTPERAEFRTDPGVLRAGLLAAGYRELPIEARHVLAMSLLAPLHADPFDRILPAQATVEGMGLS
jgi:PIN domain nuclease of toxin-antitoxin system